MEKYQPYKQLNSVSGPPNMPIIYLSPIHIEESLVQKASIVNCSGSQSLELTEAELSGSFPNCTVCVFHRTPASRVNPAWQQAFNQVGFNLPRISTSIEFSECHE